MPINPADGPILGTLYGSDAMRIVFDEHAYFHRMLERGIYLPPSQYEAMFISLAHSITDLEQTIGAARESLQNLAGA